MMNIKKEVWKDIPNYEGYYQASNYGYIRSLPRIDNGGRLRKGKILKGNPNGDGYLCLSLYKDGHKQGWGIHRLIALTFLENPQNKPRVNHKDNKPSNNKLANLEWVTHQEDIDHKCRQNRQNKWIKFTHPMSGKTGPDHQCYGKKYNTDSSHPKARLVLDLQTGIYYTCCKEAAIAKGINQFTLYNKLLGNRPNNTSLIYV